MNRRFFAQGTRLAVAGAALGALGPSLWPVETLALSGSGPPFDFSDA